MKSVMGFFNIPILAVVLVGFASKKVPAIGAKISIVFFIIAYALYKFVYPIPVHYLHIYGILFIICLLIMFVSAKIAPRKELYVQKDAKAVDLTPWKYAKPVSGIVVTTLIYIYTVFSPIGIINKGEAIPSIFIGMTVAYVVISIIVFIVILKKQKLVKNK